MITAILLLLALYTLVSVEYAWSSYHSTVPHPVLDFILLFPTFALLFTTFATADVVMYAFKQPTERFRNIKHIYLLYTHKLMDLRVAV